MISLGCPKNLVDSEVMLGLLRKKGWIPSTGEEADVVVINTCGFIREAQEESIETILSMISAKEEGRFQKIVVTGCLPQRFGKQLIRELPEVDLFLGTEAFHNIHSYLDLCALKKSDMLSNLFGFVKKCKRSPGHNQRHNFPTG